MNEYVNMVGAVIDIAEHTSYLELTSRICFYGEPNLNNDMLPFDDTVTDKAQTLVNMPVQAKYKVNQKGEPTFSGHEMIRKKDGSVEFKTSSIGTHTEVYIEDDNVDVNGVIKKLPCLFAKYRIWKRYSNVVAAVRRLFDLGKLYSSWEINTFKYIFDRGIRKITDYEFIANTLLGFEYAYPSYGTSANAINMAEVNENQLMIAEAFSQDLIEETEKKEEQFDMGTKVEPTIAEGAVKVPEATNTKSAGTAENNKHTTDKLDKPVTDSAQLTTYDLRNRISTACAKKIDQWCYVAYMFPNENEVWCEYREAETELDYVKFTYEVGKDDSITVSEPEYVKLTVSITEVNSKIASLEKELEATKAELGIKNDAITKASETIQELKISISELTPFKEKVEAAEQKRIETEISEDKERLKSKLLRGNLFTEIEIAEKNIADLIEARNESAINSLIADKFVASFDSENDDESVATAETKTDKLRTATASLESDDDDTDIRSFMSKILFN